MTKLRALMLCLCSTASLSAVDAHAQASQSTVDAPYVIDEVVVTAQKRSERISTVPMSITAVTGDQLTKQGINNPADLEKIVPGFTYQSSNYGLPIFSIRGIGDYDIALAVAPAVTVYVDQVALPYAAMTEGATIDVQRVEALKGPQGTLFGQNSTGGAINYIANKPTSSLGYGGDLTYGSFNEVNLHGFVSGPIRDNLRARVALRTEFRGPWQESYTRDASLGKKDFQTGRVLVDWDPFNPVKLEFNLNGWRDKSDTQAAQFIKYVPSVLPGRLDPQLVLPTYPVAPHNARAADWDKNFSLARDDEFFQGSVRADIALSDLITLTSISTYSHLHAYDPVDSDGTNYLDFRITIHGNVSSAAQEVRLAGTLPNDRLRWMIGANYQHDRVFDDQYAEAMGTNDQVGPYKFNGGINGNHQTISTYAAFGSLDYKLTDTLTLQGSLRYTKLEDAFKGCLFDNGDGTAATVFSFLSGHTIAPGQCVTLSDATNSPIPIVSKELHEQNLPWRVSLNWQLSYDALLYANVTRGFKAGGFSTISPLKESADIPDPQESLLAYEAGVKTSWLSHTLQLAGAVYYYDYRRKQIYGEIDSGPPFGRVPGLVSIPFSSVRGAELDVHWNPIRQLTLSLGGSHVDSKVDKSFITPDAFNKEIDVKGEAFPNAPRWQASGDAEYNFPITDAVQGFIGGAVSYRSRSFANFGNDPIFELPSRTILDVRAGAESKDGHWRAQVWGRNVTNLYYWVNVSHVIDTVNYDAGMPATYGITLSYRY
jgi:outer membrane receptor protein involved in Fe transport